MEFFQKIDSRRSNVLNVGVVGVSGWRRLLLTANLDVILGRVVGSLIRMGRTGDRVDTRTRVGYIGYELVWNGFSQVD